MKHKNYFVLLVACLGLALSARAQEAQQSSEDKEKQELRRKFLQGMQARRIERAQAMTVAVQTNRYNHREEEIMAKLNIMNIPEDFPIYKPGYTDEQYIQLMNEWYNTHPHMLRNQNEQK